MSCSCRPTSTCRRGMEASRRTPARCLASIAPCRGRARVYASPSGRQRYHRAPMTKVEIALPGQADADALALPVAQPLGGDGAKIVDEKLHGRLEKLRESGELRGERGEAILLYLNGELEAPRLVAAGVGRREDVDADALRTAGAATAQ